MKATAIPALIGGALLSSGLIIGTQDAKAVCTAPSADPTKNDCLVFVDGGGATTPTYTYSDPLTLLVNPFYQGIFTITGPPPGSGPLVNPTPNLGITPLVINGVSTPIAWTQLATGVFYSPVLNRMGSIDPTVVSFTIPAGYVQSGGSVRLQVLSNSNSAFDQNGVILDVDDTTNPNGNNYSETRFSFRDTATNPSVPGPLPLMGAAAAFGYSRKLRRRIQASA